MEKEELMPKMLEENWVLYKLKNNIKWKLNFNIKLLFLLFTNIKFSINGYQFSKWSYKF